MITHPEVENAPRPEMMETTETRQTEAPIARDEELRQAALAPSSTPTPPPTTESLTAPAPTSPAISEEQPNLMTPTTEPKPRVGAVMIGVGLIVVGALALVAAIFQSSLVGLLVLPALGAMFLAWGFVARQPGPLIPGGILTGLGLGVLISQYWPTALPGEVTGAIVVTGLAIGFLAIAPLTWLVSGQPHYWALIPGGILALVGVSMFVSANTFLSFLGIYVWPVALVVVGAVLLWRAYRPHGER